jgi:hypothetical protein
MNKSLYEQYVFRNPKRADINEVWGKGDAASLTPFRFENRSGPVKSSVGILWVTKDCATGVNAKHSPHKHDYDETFLFLGTNPDDLNDLGADVEFWLGEGEHTEIIALNTTAFVFIPKGLLHMPMYFRNVRRPLMRILIGSTEKEVIRYPVREA